MAGCGNSRTFLHPRNISFIRITTPLYHRRTGLTEDMFDDGYHSIVNVDISKVVIDQMVERYKDKDTLQVHYKLFAAAVSYPLSLPSRHNPPPTPHTHPPLSLSGKLAT